MKYLISVLCVLFTITTAASAGEPLQLNYEYKVSASDPDLRKLKGSIAIDGFRDTRSDAGTPQIQAQSAAEPRPLAIIVTDAFVQAFIANGADVTDVETRFVIEGEITELTTSSRDDSLEVVIKAKVALKDGGRTIWENGLFSRAAASTEADALQLGITKLVQELLVDDYFLMEII